MGINISSRPPAPAQMLFPGASRGTSALHEVLGGGEGENPRQHTLLRSPQWDPGALQSFPHSALEL